MKIFGLLVLGISLGFGVVDAFHLIPPAHAQNVKVVAGGQGADGPNKYEPTPEQLKDLQIGKDAITIAGQKMQLIQDSMKEAITEYNQAVATINATADKIKKANGWPDSTTFDVEHVHFSAPAKPASVNCDAKGGPDTCAPATPKP